MHAGDEDAVGERHRPPLSRRQEELDPGDGIRGEAVDAPELLPGAAEAPAERERPLPEQPPQGRAAAFDRAAGDEEAADLRAHAPPLRHDHAQEVARIRPDHAGERADPHPRGGLERRAQRARDLGAAALAAREPADRAAGRLPLDRRGAPRGPGGGDDERDLLPAAARPGGDGVTREHAPAGAVEDVQERAVADERGRPALVGRHLQPLERVRGEAEGDERPRHRGRDRPDVPQVEVRLQRDRQVAGARELGDRRARQRGAGALDPRHDEAQADGAAGAEAVQRVAARPDPRAQQLPELRPGREARPRAPVEPLEAALLGRGRRPARLPGQPAREAAERDRGERGGGQAGCGQPYRQPHPGLDLRPSPVDRGDRDTPRAS